MMKNLYKIFTLLFFVAFSACDSTEDIFKELDALSDDSGLVEDKLLPDYTLTDDDYDLIDHGFGNFSNDDDAKSKIPTVLEKNFSPFGKGSSILVSYNFYNGSGPDLRGTQTVVTVPSTDYDLIHGYDGFDNFGNPDEDVLEWVIWKEYAGEDGDYIDVTFDYYDGSFHGDAVSRIVYTVAYGWMYAEPLPNVYQDFFGESHNNFSNSDEGEEKIPVYLNNTLLFAEAGDFTLIEYLYYDGNTSVPAVALFGFNGTEWLLYDDHYRVSSKSLQFGHDGSVWVPDNTVTITLGAADYTAISAATATSNDAGSASMGNFGNYDLGLWTSTQIFDSITARLIELYPTVEGQQYVVNYATWEPGAGTGTVSVIYQGGEYVAN